MNDALRLGIQLTKIPSGKKRTTAKACGLYINNRTDLAMLLALHFTTLEASGLIRLAQVQPELEYLFRHALIQDAAYNSLVRADRRALHRAVGETLEQIYAARLDDMAATLAYHFERAEAHVQALHYFERAADRAKAAYANEEAIVFYRAAIEQANHLSRAGMPTSDRLKAQLAQLHESLGDLLELTGKLEEARAAYDSASRYVPQTDRVARSRVQRKIGTTWSLRSRYQDAADAYDLAEKMLGAEPYEPVVVWWQEWSTIQLNRMDMYYWQGQWREVARLAEQTQPILQQYGTPALRFHFYDGLISVDERRNRYVISDDVLHNARAMLAAAQESGDQRLIALGHFQLGFCLLWHDDFDEAEAYLRTGEEMMRRIGDAIWLTHTLTYLGILHRRRGKMDAARPYIMQALATARANQMTLSIARAEANLAWLSWHEAKVDEANQHGLDAIGLWSQSSFVDPFQWTGYLPLAAVALHKDQIAESVHFARAMLESARHRLPDPIDEPLIRAVQFFEQGQTDSARSCLRRAIAAAEQLHYL